MNSRARSRREWPLAEQVRYQRDRIAAEEEIIADLVLRLFRHRKARTVAKRQLSKLTK